MKFHRPQSETPWMSKYSLNNCKLVFVLFRCQYINNMHFRAYKINNIYVLKKWTFLSLQSCSGFTLVQFFENSDNESRLDRTWLMYHTNTDINLNTYRHTAPVLHPCLLLVTQSLKVIHTFLFTSRHITSVCITYVLLHYTCKPLQTSSVNSNLFFFFILWLVFTKTV